MSAVPFFANSSDEMLLDSQAFSAALVFATYDEICKVKVLKYAKKNLDNDRTRQLFPIWPFESDFSYLRHKSVAFADRLDNKWFDLDRIVDMKSIA
jgi:hypothetical protein